eukprot:TRINITY_DN2560_c0_g1_i1.p1 TRINITY_DN2560_c0_g1~~TRINITY_DN2560_c0_g1_i1.p1  ORF type:complete len:484 (+),score=134.71 TRINITY_DN2560_c0_g1_i1:23-1474(+)
MQNTLALALGQSLKVYERQLVLWDKLLEVNKVFLDNYQVVDCDSFQTGNADDKEEDKSTVTYKNLENDSKKRKREQEPNTNEQPAKKSKSVEGNSSPYRQPKSTEEPTIPLTDSGEIPPHTLKEKFNAAREAISQEGAQCQKAPQAAKEPEVHVRFDDEPKPATPAKPTSSQTPKSILKVTRSLVKQKAQVFKRSDHGSISCAPLSARSENPSRPVDLSARPVDLSASQLVSPPTSPTKPFSPRPVHATFLSPKKPDPSKRPHNDENTKPSQNDENTPKTPKVFSKPTFKSPKSPRVVSYMKSPSSTRKSPAAGSGLCLPVPESCSPAGHASNYPYRAASPGERFSLSSPVLRRPPTTPKFSPVNLPESPKTGKECTITDYYFNSEDVSSDSDEEVELRYWCKKENLNQILERQQYIDPDAVFGMPNTKCDLTEIFGRRRTHYERTEKLSGVWSQDEMGSDEESENRSDSGSGSGSEVETGKE